MNVDEDENVEYVYEQLDANGSVLEAFSDVFARFQLPPEESAVSPVALVRTAKPSTTAGQGILALQGRSNLL